MELPYDLANPLLDVYPKELQTGTQTNTCACMFIEALFTIAKRWKQLKRPSADEWRDKLWYIHTMEYYSAIIKNKVLGFPGGPVAKTPHSQCRGPGFDSWSGTYPDHHPSPHPLETISLVSMDSSIPDIS